jgi:hypothetical protein
MSEPSGKNHCPKCGSDDVLVGNSDDPHRCGECKHKWDGKDGVLVQATTAENRVLSFKSPSILLTINQDLKRRHKSFLRRLDEAIERVLSESTCPTCGSQAYVGLQSVECSNPKCRNFKQTNAGKTLELLVGRMLGIWLDGKVSDKAFSYEADQETIHLTGLSCGGKVITELEFDKMLDVTDDVPSTVLVTYEDGTKQRGTLANHVLGDPDRDQQIALVNGTKTEVDETQVYYRFNLA